jgi:hypothetical protein
MKAAIGRLLVALCLCAIAVPAALLAPRQAQAAGNGTTAKRILDACPNPGPYWCASGYESDGCADGKLSWRGCYDTTIIE